MAQTKYICRDYDFQGNSILNASFGGLTTDQRTTLGTELQAEDAGRITYDSDLNQYYYWDGTSWNTLTGGGSTAAGGSDTHIQFNAEGALEGDQSFVYNYEQGEVKLVNGTFTIENTNSQKRLIKLTTTQGLGGTNPEFMSHFYVTMDQSHVNEDDVIDHVLHIGYNQDGGGGRVNPNDASMHEAFESHYIPCPGCEPNFERFFQVNFADGTSARPFSFTINKDSVNTSFISMEMRAGGFNFHKLNNDQLFIFNAGGSFAMTGEGDNAYLKVNNRTTAREFTIMNGQTSSSISPGQALSFSMAGEDISIENGGLHIRNNNNSVNNYPFTVLDSTASTYYIRVYGDGNTEFNGTGVTVKGVLQFDRVLYGNIAANTGFAVIDLNTTDDTVDFLEFNHDGAPVFRVGNNGATTINIAAVGDYADDAAAQTGGVAVGGIYRTGSALKIRVS